MIENLVFFGGGKVAEVDKWGFLCYNRNKFHCVKDAINCFRLGLCFALASILFVLLAVYRKSTTVLATADLLATNTFSNTTDLVLAFGGSFA